MSILTDDQLARVRFASRVHFTGNSYGASRATVEAAQDLITEVVRISRHGVYVCESDFTRIAKEILAKSEN